MSVACLMMAASCEKDGKGDSQTPEAPVITVAEGIKTAGSDLILRADGIDADAKFYLQAGEKRIDIEAEVSASGATVKLPYNLGEYTLYVEQEGASYEAGKITIAVTDVVLPADAVSSGEEIVIKGNGFASDAVIVIDGKEADSSAVPTEVTLTVPELEAGTYTVSVKQVGTEQILSESFVVGKSKIMTSYQIGMADGDEFMVFGEYTFAYENGVPVSYEFSDGSAQISVSGNIYTFTSEEVDSWSFTIENGKVANVILGGQPYSWTYDSQNHLIDFYVDNGDSYPMAWEGNNFNIGMYAYSSPVAYKNKTKSDIALLASLPGLGIAECDYILVAAVLGGWCGEVSAELPSHTYTDGGDGNYVEIPFDYTADTEGYVETVLDPSSYMTFKFIYE